MDYVSDHIARALARLGEEFKRIPRLVALVTLQARRVQELEDAAWAFRQARTLASATGQLEDFLGKWVGEERAGKTDASFRKYIAARIYLNRSSGTVPELLFLFRLLVSLPYTLRLQDSSSRPEVLLTVGNGATTPATAADLLTILRKAKMGGVRAYLQWQEDTDANSFVLDDAAAPGTTPGLGLGDTGNAATGGKLAGGTY
jgi:hypothetical protein